MGLVFINYNNSLSNIHTTVADAEDAQTSKNFRSRTFIAKCFIQYLTKTRCPSKVEAMKEKLDTFLQMLNIIPYNIKQLDDVFSYRFDMTFRIDHLRYLVVINVGIFSTNESSNYLQQLSILMQKFTVAFPLEPLSLPPGSFVNYVHSLVTLLPDSTSYPDSELVAQTGA